MPELRLWSNRQLSRLKEDMDRLFESFCLDLGLPSVSCLHDDGMVIKKEQDRILISLPLPGFRHKDINLTITSSALTVTAKRQSASGTESYSRKLQLPCKVDTDSVSAIFQKDILTITLQRCAPDSAKRIAISTK